MSYTKIQTRSKKKITTRKRNVYENEMRKISDFHNVIMHICGACERLKCC